VFLFFKLVASLLGGSGSCQEGIHFEGPGPVGGTVATLVLVSRRVFSNLVIFLVVFVVVFFRWLKSLICAANYQSI